MDFKKSKKNSEEEPEEEPEEAPEEESGPQVVFLNGFQDNGSDELSKMRMAALYGEVDEEKAAELTYTLFALKNTGRVEEPENPDDEESKLIVRYEPIELFISTYGGSAIEMFSIYDTMRSIRDECEIHTIGLGKVMSAGVLLLAAGTKGKRKIGANCRVMLHGVIAGSQGSIYSLENEMEEIRFVQEQHINALVKETKMTKRYLKKLLNREVNVYFTAKKAVELGIADEII